MLLCKANALMVSLHCQSAWCALIYLCHAAHTCVTPLQQPCQHRAFQAHLHPSFPTVVPCPHSCSTGNWTCSKSKLIVTLMPLINLFIFTLIEILAKSTKYMQVVTPNTAPKVNTGTWKYLVLTVGLKTSVMCLWYPMAVKETWGRV